MWKFLLVASLAATVRGQGTCDFRGDKKSRNSEMLGQAGECGCYNSMHENACDHKLFHPLSALPHCHMLPLEFLECDFPIDHNGNQTAKEHKGYGCVNFGGQRWEDVETTAVCCRVLECIECRGNRTFLRDGFPCIKYSYHFFVTTLLYSILLGFLGLDRFCLGHTGTAVGKLLTLGGLGVWWIVDIFLLVTGHLSPSDGSNWISLI